MGSSKERLGSLVLWMETKRSENQVSSTPVDGMLKAWGRKDSVPRQYSFMAPARRSSDYSRVHSLLPLCL